ncbi:hypothetical protein HBB16_21590 [Pseudonocardia sp. MCCB 268]|nr:hypothetical protein [Pseudonocardia cytotoxica]
MVFVVEDVALHGREISHILVGQLRSSARARRDPACRTLPPCTSSTPSPACGTGPSSGIWPTSKADTAGGDRRLAVRDPQPRPTAAVRVWTRAAARQILPELHWNTPNFAGYRAAPPVERLRRATIYRRPFGRSRPVLIDTSWQPTTLKEYYGDYSTEGDDVLSSPGRWAGSSPCSPSRPPCGPGPAAGAQRVRVIGTPVDISTRPAGGAAAPAGRVAGGRVVSRSLPRDRQLPGTGRELGFPPDRGRQKLVTWPLAVLSQIDDRDCLMGGPSTT